MKKQQLKKNRAFQNPSDITTQSLGNTDNENLFLFVHKNGNTAISLHNVDSLKIGKWETNKRENKKDFQTKTILIISEGIKQEITLFKKD